MLCIERRPGESFFIGNDIHIELLSLGRSWVKLAIRAPRTVPILRDEASVRHDVAAAGDGASPASMLIVRRRAGELLSIGPEIGVGVQRIASAHAILGVSAPRHLRIERTESSGKPAANLSKVSQGFPRRGDEEVV